LALATLCLRKCLAELALKDAVDTANFLLFSQLLAITRKALT
jgi:hypothetical protein